MDTYKLYNGIEIPTMGLGTAALSKKTMMNSIKVAYECGCSLIDTAHAYDSEVIVGEAIQTLCQNSCFKREDLFISSKIGDKINEIGRPIGYYFYSSPSAPCHDTKRIVYEQTEEILKHLKTSYIDLMLIHWPYYEVLNEIWKYFEELYDQKVFRAIGVSNCKKRHLERIMRNSNYVPMVNQFNISPINICKEDYDFCKENQIVMEAYSPLYPLRCPLKKEYLHVFESVAKLKNKTNAQILLRWYYQKGIIPLPKSGTTERLVSNYNIFDFELSEEEIHKLDNLNMDYNYLVESIFCPGY